MAMATAAKLSNTLNVLTDEIILFGEKLSAEIESLLFYILYYSLKSIKWIDEDALLKNMLHTKYVTN